MLLTEFVGNLPVTYKSIPVIDGGTSHACIEVSCLQTKVNISPTQNCVLVVVVSLTSILKPT